MTPGVIQRNTLACYLFCIVLDFTLRKATESDELHFVLEQKKIRRVFLVVTADLAFANDIAPISQEIEAAQEVESSAAKTEMCLSVRKTEIQPFNITRPLGIITVSDDYIILPTGGRGNLLVLTT